jgi:hypothetical protein
VADELCEVGLLLLLEVLNVVDAVPDATLNGHPILPVEAAEFDGQCRIERIEVGLKNIKYFASMGCQTAVFLKQFLRLKKSCRLQEKFVPIHSRHLAAAYSCNVGAKARSSRLAFFKKLTSEQQATTLKWCPTHGVKENATSV